MDRDLELYLGEKGWTWKLVEGQRQVQIQDDCPFCGKAKHLYFEAATTKWDCKRCGETGNLLTMKRLLGDLKVDVRSAYDFVFYRGAKDGPRILPGERPPEGVDEKFHQRLMEGKAPSVLEYLTDVRGFTTETLERFKIGVAGKGNNLMVSIPHYYRGELVCIKFRSVPPSEKMFTRWKDCPSILFNCDCLEGMDQLPPRERRVAVCEGEFDAMALVQLGFEKVVASTTGAGKTDWPAHWLEPLEPATTILLPYDADGAGEDGAEKAAAVLGRYRCRRVVPPLHDCAECVAAGLEKDMMDQAIKNSREYDDTVVRPMAVFAEDLRKKLATKQPKGRSTGWLSLDAILGGVRDGELTVVTGDTGSGKSTWTTAIARNQMLQDVPVLIAPFEQTPSDILGKFVGMECGQSIYDLTKIELDHQLETVVEYPIYMIDRAGQMPIGEVKDAIYIAVQRYGVKFVVLDHLHFFLECRPEDERLAIDAAMRSMATWVKDLNVHVALVVHPKGLGKNAKGEVLRVTVDDLKGSSEIKKTAWNIIRVWRNRKEVMGSRADDTEIAVLKCRSTAGAEGATMLHFDPNGERYIEGTYSLGKGKRSAASGKDAAAGETMDDWEDWDTVQ